MKTNRIIKKITECWSLNSDVNNWITTCKAHFLYANLCNHLSFLVREDKKT